MAYSSPYLMFAADCRHKTFAGAGSQRRRMHRVLQPDKTFFIETAAENPPAAAAIPLRHEG